MAIIINELEVTESRPEVPDRDEQSRSAATAASELIGLVDFAQRLAQLEERELRVEAN